MVETRKVAKLNLPERTYLNLLLVIFGLIVFHAPISVVLGTILPEYILLIKSWKEILMVVAFGLGLVILIKRKQLDILRDPIIYLISAYVILHFLTAIFTNSNYQSIFAGLAIDLRYVVYFGLVFVGIKIAPSYINCFIKLGISGALIVVIFAVMQVFILPKEILSYIGYNSDTILPYLLVDQNQSFVRINSTLRGPNPLGAYAMMIVVFTTSFLVFKLKNDILKLINRLKYWIIILILFFGGLITLWSSYSRSADLGLIVALVIFFVLTLGKNIFNKKIILPFIAVCLVTVLILAQNYHFVSNVFLHENPSDSSISNSNNEHASSLRESFNDALGSPFGGGIGSSGSASLLSDKPLIIENQYLLIAHEAGWLGLIVFIAIFGFVMYRLYQNRRDWLAVAVFASGIGLAIIGLVLPVWVDDTVSIIWWGLAGLALASLDRTKEL